MNSLRRIWRFFRSILLAVAVMLPVSIIGSFFLYREFFYWEYWSREGWEMLIEYNPQIRSRPPQELPDWGAATVPPPSRDILAVAGMIRRGEYDRIEFLARRTPAALDGFADTSPDLEEALDTWVRKRPDSIPARLTRAAYWQHIAEDRRGELWSSLTTEAQFRRMEDAYARAEEDLLAVIRREPGQPHAYPRIIRIYAWSGRRGEIQAIWRQAVSAGAATTELHRALFFSLTPRWSGLSTAESIAAVEAVLGDIESGALRGTADLAILGAYPDFLRADSLRLSGDHEGALDLYAGFIDGPSGRFLLDDHARALGEAGRWGEALRAYAAYLGFNPSDVDILGELGEALYRARHFGQAEEVIARALALDPYDADALLVSGNLHVMRGELDMARECFERALVHGGERESIMVRLHWVRSRLGP